MPLQRDEKEVIVAEMIEQLGKAEAVLLADYRGLNVVEISQLRRNLRDAGSQLQVIKNTLAQRAFAKADIELPEEMLLGPTAVVLLFEELAAPAKALLECAKATNRLVIKGGFMDGRLLDEDGVKALSSLPTREELLGLLLGVLTAPQRNTVTVLHAPMRDFVGVLRARVDEGDTVEAAA
jgi:large subunit ribosomal protein L10